MMDHQMKLNPQPFEMIAKGLKTIELRLYDEKRRKIKVGDTIVFSNTEQPEKQIVSKVIRLHIFDSFTTLYEALPLEKCGYLPEELADALPDDMLLYYSDKMQSQYGVVGIELEVQCCKDGAVL